MSSRPRAVAKSGAFSSASLKGMRVPRRAPRRAGPRGRSRAVRRAPASPPRRWPGAARSVRRGRRPGGRRRSRAPRAASAEHDALERRVRRPARSRRPPPKRTSGRWPRRGPRLSGARCGVHASDLGAWGAPVRPVGAVDDGVQDALFQATAPASSGEIRGIRLGGWLRRGWARHDPSVRKPGTLKRMTGVPSSVRPDRSAARRSR